jgi:hypothetical protein
MSMNYDLDMGTIPRRTVIYPTLDFKASSGTTC